MKKLFILILIQVLLLSCTSLRTKVPYAEVESPDLAGKKNVDLNFISMSQYMKYEASSDASKRPPTFSEPSDLNMTNLASANLGAAYGISENFDIGISVGTESGLKLKYLVFKSLNENQDGHLLSVFGKYASNYNSNSGDQNGVFGDGGYPWKGTAETINSNLGISYGYQKDNMLYYAGIAYNNLNSDFAIHDSASPANSSPEAHYSYKVTGYSNTASLGLVAGKIDRFQLSLNYSNLYYGNYTKSAGHLTAGYSHHFDDFFNRPQKMNYELTPKETWKGSDFGATLLSLYIGFGTGQAIQGNWDAKGFYFACADAASLAILVSSTNSSQTSAGSSALLYTISRIWQIVDVIMDASSSTHMTYKYPLAMTF